MGELIEMISTIGLSDAETDDSGYRFAARPWSVPQKTNFKDTVLRFSTGHFLDGTTFLIGTMFNLVLSDIAGGLH